MEMTKIYHSRKSIRLQNYDYAQNGMYYVLILSFKYIKIGKNYRDKITTIIKGSYSKVIKKLSF